MAALEDKHSGAYMCKVLLSTLEDFNIEYNIKRYILLLLLLLLLISL